MILTHDVRARLCRARDRLEVVGDRATLDAVAREAGMSWAHFIRTFAAVFGETPHQLRTRARLDHARDLLAEGDLPVTDVCFALGFASLGSFSAMFHRHSGVSPSMYRRRWHALGALPARKPGCFELAWMAWSSHFPRSGPAASR